MKKTVSLSTLIALSIFSFAQNTKIFSTYNDLENKNIYYLFATDVKLREEPNSTSKVLKTLAIGTAIEITAKTNETMVYEGETVNWYKVKYNDMTGYVLRSLIAIEYQEYGSTKYLFNTAKIGDINKLKVRVLTADGKLIDQKYSLNNESFEIDIDGSKGLDGVQEIIFIDYYADACGIDGGGIYLFYDGQNLIKAAEIQQVADGGVFWYSEEIIFPDDDETLKNKIRYTRDAGELVDEETNQIESSVFSREYEWTGSGWNPPLDQE